MADPAYRDVDAQSRVAGRFEERIRRTWNAVRTSEIERAGDDLAALADAIAAAAGADRGHVLARLREFAAWEKHERGHEDPLVRPGVGLEATA